MKKLVFIFPILCVFLVAISCDHEPFARTTRDLTPDEGKLVEADNRFGFKLFGEVLQQDHDKNVFVSPLSAAMALAMAYNGAGGETREAMEEALELSGMTQESVNESYRSLIDLLLHQDPKVDFRIANSIWYREGFPVEEEFINTNTTCFDALVNELDFNSTDAADTINDWVDESTNGKIKEIIDSPIDPILVMILINAIYFKATWRYEFEERDTYEGVFTLEDGGTRTCNMMKLEQDLAYMSTEDFQAVDLPYGDAGFSMTVILPQEGVDIDTVVDRLDQENWSAWLGQLSERPIDLRLPKFKLEYEIEMTKVLEALGMAIAFRPGEADFTGISRSGDLFISKVKHKTFVEVNEEGTEAAAVTSVGVGTTSIGPDTIPLHVDRPYIFIIRESATGTILFMGRILEPPLS